MWIGVCILLAVEIMAASVIPIRDKHFDHPIEPEPRIPVRDWIVGIDDLDAVAVVFADDTGSLMDLLAFADDEIGEDLSLLGAVGCQVRDDPAALEGEGSEGRTDDAMASAAADLETEDAGLGVG